MSEIIVDPEDGIPLIVTDCEIYPSDDRAIFTMLQERKRKENLQSVLDELRDLFK